MKPYSLKFIILLIFVTSSLSSITAQTTAENDSSAAAAKKNKNLPLITTRSLKFTTDEGSWISLDLAPNGKTLVFELLGDLYTLPISGGKATRITEGQADFYNIYI